MNNTNFKEDSIFTSGNIKSVIFDLDDTLFETGEYYKTNMLLIAEHVSKLLEDNTPNIAEKIYEQGVIIHKEVGHPMLLDNLMKAAITRIYGDNLSKEEEIDSYLKKEVELFYQQTPKLKSGSLPVLDMVNTLGITIGIHSHSQHEWTERKVKYIQDSFKERYGREISILLHSTPLEGKKDKEGWGEALRSFNFDPNTTLIVGDNLRDDILPAQANGVKYLVLINNSIYSSNAVLKGDGNILRISDIEELLTL